MWAFIKDLVRSLMLRIFYYRTHLKLLKINPYVLNWHIVTN
jgi:hypothetical protein